MVQLRTRSQHGESSGGRRRTSADVTEQTDGERLLALQRTAGNAAVAGLLGARHPAISPGGLALQRLTSIVWNRDNDQIRTAQYQRTPPMRLSLTIKKGAHVTAHVLFVSEALQAIEGSDPIRAFAELRELINEITDRELYKAAVAKDPALVREVDAAIATINQEYAAPKALTDFDRLFWGEILAELFDAYISLRASLPGAIAGQMSGQKQNLAHANFIYNEAKGMALMREGADRLWDAEEEDPKPRKSTLKQIRELFAGGMAVTFDSKAALEVGHDMEYLFAEHVRTCFERFMVPDDHESDLQAYFLSYSGGEDLEAEVSKLTGVKSTSASSLDLRALNLIMDSIKVESAEKSADVGHVRVD